MLSGRGTEQTELPSEPFNMNVPPPLALEAYTFDKEKHFPIANNFFAGKNKGNKLLCQDFVKLYLM